MLVWVAVAWAGPELAVQRHLDAGRPAAAQRVCERHQAWLREAPRVLREICAEALWFRAVEEGTYAGWVRYQQDWAGTKRGAVGREMEATVRLDEIGEEASEADYTAWLAEYRSTGIAARARELQARAAVRAVASLDEARRVAREYPDAPELEAALAPWFEHFVHLRIEGERVDVRLEPELRLAGATLRVEWAGRDGDRVLGWDGAALRHFDGQGVPRDLATRLARGGEGLWFPPCSIPGVELGVRVTYGSLSAFFPRPRSCGPWPPVVVSERDGRMTALSPWPGLAVAFAGPTDREVPHRQDATTTRVAVLGEPRPEVRVGDGVLWQGMATSADGARIWLARPLAGGLPSYSVSPPGGEAPELPAAAVGGAPGAEAAARDLPDGNRRVWSPLLQSLLGLHAGHPAARAAASPPPAPRALGAEPAPAVPAEDLARLSQELAAYGVEASEAWRVPLLPDLGLEVVFRGRLGGAPVKGVLDPQPDGSTRLFVWFDDLPGGRAVRPRTESGAAFGWVGAGADGRSTESLRVDERGLVRAVDP